jgi:hypothetical protein
MSAENKKTSGKHLLSVTGLHHLKTLEREVERRQTAVVQKEWNYSNFVAHLLEVIVRLRDKQIK